MNQILSTSMQEEKKEKASIKTIIIVFSVAILIFGIFLIGTGVYAFISNNREVENKNIEPSISIENKTEDTILIKIMHKKNIKSLEYWWNEDDSNFVNGKNGKYLEEQIKLPSGKNTLNLVVTDESGNQTTYEKEFETASNINIQVSQNNRIKITSENEKIVLYLTYKWDSGEEQTIQINNNKVEQEIDAIKGEHLLTVTTVFADNTTDKKIQKVKGVSKPTVEVSVDRAVEHFVIDVSDEEKLEKIVFVLNQDGQEYIINLADMNIKEFSYTLQMELKQGDNVIEVTAYNSSGVSEYIARRFIKGE